MVKITINYEKCDGADCAECVDVCPMEVLIINGDKIVIQNKKNAAYAKFAWMYALKRQ